MYWESEVLWFHREKVRKLCTGDPPRPYPMCLFIWLVGICVPCNKTVIISITLSGVLWVILTNYQACHGNIQIYSQSVKSIGGLRSPEAQLASEAKTALQRADPLTCGSVRTAGGSTRIELQDQWVNTRVSRVELQTWCHRKMVFEELISSPSSNHSLWVSCYYITGKADGWVLQTECSYAIFQ